MKYIFLILALALPWSAAHAEFACPDWFKRLLATEQFVKPDLSGLVDHKYFLDEARPIRDQFFTIRPTILNTNRIDPTLIELTQSPFFVRTMDHLQQALESVAPAAKSEDVTRELFSIRASLGQLTKAERINYFEYLNTVRRFTVLFEFLHARIVPNSTSTLTLKHFKPEALAKQQKYFLSDIATSISKGRLLVPEVYSVDVRELNDLMVERIYPLGISFEPQLNVDGVVYTPSRFFSHDVAHAISSGQILLQDIDIPADLATLKLYRQKVLSIAKAEHDVRLGELIWFMSFHEGGIANGVSLSSVRQNLDYNQRIEGGLADMARRFNSEADLNSYFKSQISEDELKDFIQLLHKALE